MRTDYRAYTTHTGKKLLYLLPLLLLLSCHNRTEQLKHDIVGDWKFVKQTDSTKKVNENEPERTYLLSDFICYEDGRYFEKNGFFDFDTLDGHNIIKYFGWDSKYKIERNTHFVMDMRIKDWRQVKIHTLKGDTLIYDMGDDRYCFFERQHYKLNPDEQYDGIVVNSTGCYGTCPRSNVFISNNGKMYFEGLSYTTVQGNFTSNIGTATYKQIEEEFKKAELPKDSVDCTDGQVIIVTFIKNSKVVKSVSECATYIPSAFSAAYDHVLNLYQTVNLTKTTESSPELEKWKFIRPKSFKSSENEN